MYILGFLLKTLQTSPTKDFYFFPLIQRMFPDLAGKITGMLLEIDNAELVHMLEDQNSLKGKVEEAVAVLQAHQGKGDKK
jgi:hypothetical protein